MGPTIWYFAYGSNMDSHRLEERVGRSGIKWQKGKLTRYRLAFNKISSSGEGGYANIIQDNNGTVYGVLYLLTEEELQKLDRCEGVPNHYGRVTLPVETEESIVRAVCYVAAEDKVREGLKPSRKYLEHLVRGAQEHNLPPDYTQQLRETETL